MNYAKLNKQLWATEISDHFPEDAKIKKLIANVNFGLLEKGTNKSLKVLPLIVFEMRLREVGGKINKITGYDENDQELDNKYYCLTVSHCVALRSGYTYIKELLLQIHNHKIQEDYTKLLNNRVDVWSVKTDATRVLKQSKESNNI